MFWTIKDETLLLKQDICNLYCVILTVKGIMGQISTNEFKQGLKIIIENEPCEIIENEFHKPGKGQAVMRVKYRNLINSKVLEKTFKTGESVEKAEISSVEMQFLYRENEKVVLMNNQNYEQFECDLFKIERELFWMKEGENYEVVFWEDSLICIEIDNFVEIAVKETDPGLKGDTATNTLKPATLENGIEIKVPLFISPGDLISVDTRNIEYQGRSGK